MTRRNFITGILGMFGIGAATKSADWRDVPPNVALDKLVAKYGKRIIVTGQPQTFHCRMPLEPVGQDWDGAYYVGFEYIAIDGPITSVG